jgi:hypothetical protein
MAPFHVIADRLYQHLVPGVLELLQALIILVGVAAMVATDRALWAAVVVPVAIQDAGAAVATLAAGAAAVAGVVQHMAAVALDYLV